MIEEFFRTIIATLPSQNSGLNVDRNPRSFTLQEATPFFAELRAN